jgi:hypothetical protein
MRRCRGVELRRLADGAGTRRESRAPPTGSTASVCRRLTYAAPTPQRGGRTLFWHYPHYANQGRQARRRGSQRAVEADRVLRKRAARVVRPCQAAAKMSREISPTEKPELVAELAGKLGGVARASRSTRRCRRRTPTIVPNPAGQGRHASRSRPARPRYTERSTPLRTAPAQEYARLLDEPGRLRDARVHRRRSRDDTKSRSWQGLRQRTKEAARPRSSSPGRTLTFTVEDTGHFQNFVPRVIGTVQ